MPAHFTTPYNESNFNNFDIQKLPRPYFVKLSSTWHPNFCESGIGRLFCSTYKFENISFSQELSYFLSELEFGQLLMRINQELDQAYFEIEKQRLHDEGIRKRCFFGFYGSQKLRNEAKEFLTKRMNEYCLGTGFNGKYKFSIVWRDVVEYSPGYPYDITHNHILKPFLYIEN